MCNLFCVSTIDTLWGYKDSFSMSFPYDWCNFTLCNLSWNTIVFHSMMKHGIILWDNSPKSKIIFILNEKIVRIMAGVTHRNSCSGLFKRLVISPFPYQFISPLMNFIVNNQEHFQTNSAVYSVNTKNKHHLTRPTANLSCFQKRAYYAGINIFNNLPSNLKSLMTKKV
jgi:hypothetical protein